MLYYRINISGSAQLVDDTGKYIIVAVPESPPPPPDDWLVKIIRIRSLINDPIAGDFYLTNRALPDVGTEGIAYVHYDDVYDGKYWFYENGTWLAHELVFSDSYIRDIYNTTGSVEAAARYLFTQIFLRIEDVYRVISENDGGQSMSFPSLAELAAFYKEKQAAIEALICEESPKVRCTARLSDRVGYVKDCWRDDED